MSVHHFGHWNTYDASTEEWDQLTYEFSLLSLKDTGKEITEKKAAELVFLTH